MIRILPDRVANQIAAGEVIERPAAAVKELVENALDAGATRVEVEFRHGGQELIRVEDNGSGMSRDDALLSLERHATSKIAEAADLDRLASFGFRGEALPSIASVARFTLRTRRAEDAAGTEIAINAGKIWHVRDCGRPVGTSMVVEHLFHPVPARRKFLKSEATESAHIVQAVRLYALAFPQVAFSLVEEGRRIFQSPRCETLGERVGEIFGKELAEELVPIAAAEDGWEMRGLIGRPGRGRAGRQEMIVYVNRRPVDSRAIHFALIESFRESLPEGRYPVAFLFFTCDPSQVDVNVHPAKREIRIRKEPEVRRFIVRSILQRLRELGAGYAAGAGAEVDAGSESKGAPGAGPFPAAMFGGPAEGKKESFSSLEAQPGGGAAGVQAGSGYGAEGTLPMEGQVHEGPVSGVGNAAPAAPHSPKPGRETPTALVANWRWIGVSQGYGIFETPSGVVLVDRRAAAERLVYEQLKGEFKLGERGSQRLLLPVALELDPINSALLVDARDFLNAHDFEVADFGRHFFRLEAVPSWMEPADAEPFLRDLLSALRDGRLDTRDNEFAREQLALIASQRAARLPAAVLSAGAAEEEMRHLLSRLFATALPLTTPSGRPTFIELSWNELSRRFQR